MGSPSFETHNVWCRTGLFSYNAVPVPMDADGKSLDRNQEMTASSSDKISLNKFVVTITSNCAGLAPSLHRCIIYVEVICCDIWISCSFLSERFYATNEKEASHLLYLQIQPFVTFASCFHVMSMMPLLRNGCKFLFLSQANSLAPSPFASSRSPKVNTASQLTNDDEIYILYEFLFSGNTLAKMDRFYRTQVTEQTKLLTKTKIAFSGRIEGSTLSH